MFSNFSVRKPYTVLVGVVLVIILGVVSFTKMTTDLLPSISLPYVVVMTTYVGADPETVESVVTEPIEASMATVSNIVTVSSTSSEHYSMVILEFTETADMDSVSLEIRENLDQIGAYWDDSIGSPIIMKIDPSMMPIMTAAAGVEGMTTAEVSEYVANTLIPELESIEGVASVDGYGLLEESVNVIIRQDKIDAINDLVMQGIDSGFVEAEQDMTDAEKELIDAEKDLSDGLVEIDDGLVEITDAKTELTEGQDSLEGEQNSTNVNINTAKQELLTAKTTLEVMKTEYSSNLSTAQLAYDTLFLYSAESTYSTLATTYNMAVMSGDSAAIASAKSAIDTFKTTFLANSMLAMMVDNDTTGSMSTMYTTLESLEWTSMEAQVILLGMPSSSTTSASLGTTSTPSTPGLLTSFSETSMVAQGMNSSAVLNESINIATGGVGYPEFAVTAATAIAGIEGSLEEVDNALYEVEKGVFTAAIAFATANSELSLAEYQLESGETELNSAKEQLESAKDDLADAWEQINEGKESIEEARVEAYDSADMNNVLTIDLVNQLLAAQNFSMPAGYVTEDGVSYLVRVGDQPGDVDSLKELPLMNMNMDEIGIITLGDVADVFYTDNSDEIYANVNGTTGVMLSIQKQTGYATGEVSDSVNEKFIELQEQVEGLELISLMDQGIYIDMVVDAIFSNILWGGLLAVVILLLFLKDIRPTIIIACSIPISIVAAIVCMYFSGVTLNIISLGGLALGIGMLVDNSIVVIENIYRLRNEGMSRIEAAKKGASEVAGAIMASTLTTTCVFAPIVFIEGMTKQLFVDMGLTIAYSLGASLIVALTVVPSMASKMLNEKEKKPGGFMVTLSNIYAKSLRFILKIKFIIIPLAFVLLFVSAKLSLSLGTEYIPSMESTQMTVTINMPAGCLLEDTVEVTDTLIDRIREIDDVLDIGASVGDSTSSMLGMGAADVSVSTLYLTTVDDKELSNDEIKDLILEASKDLNAEISVSTSNMDMSSLTGSGISIEIRGRDIDTLQSMATEIASIMEGVEGTTDISDGLADADEELRIIIDREKAINYGLTVAQVYMEVAAKLATSEVATTLITDAKDYSVYVMNESNENLTRELLKEITFTGTNEDREEVDVLLSDIASFEVGYSLTAINRTEQIRYVTVSAGIADDYNVALVSADLETVMEEYVVPDGYSLVYSGENESINEALEQLLLMLALAVVFMYLIMVAQFQSLLSPFIIMFTIPLAFTGGFLALYLTGNELSVISMIGFIMLAGIIVNNGIVLIDYMNQLMEEGLTKKDAIVQAGKIRLRPVLMTALTTILALSTMVFSDDMGSEMMKGMALVTIGGLVYGTLLTLIVIPCVYDWFRKDKKIVGEE
ncbi:MAG: efflux RND transporter permease subunit [Lachnospiraceae bacterium]